MRDMLAAFILVSIFIIAFAPENAGNTAHKIFNGLKTGWEQVQP